MAGHSTKRHSINQTSKPEHKTNTTCNIYKYDSFTGRISCRQQRLRSNCADAEADLNFRRAHMSADTFSHVVAPEEGQIE